MVLGYLEYLHVVWSDWITNNTLSQYPKTWVLNEGGIGIFGLRFWIFFWSVFRFLCQKTSVFRFWCSMQFADFSFLASGFRFSQKILAVFRFWYPMWFLAFPIFFFPIWTYLGIQFCIRFSVLADFVCGFAVLDERFFGFAVSTISQCPPPKCTPSVNAAYQKYEEITSQFSILRKYSI